MKKIFCIACALVMFSASHAFAACTAEEAQAKAQKFMEVAMSLAQKEPAKYQEVAQAMQTQLPELQKVNDLEGLCKFYDEWTAKME